MKRRKAKPTSTMTIVDVPRRWWQSKHVQLRCSCGWLSPETWPARPSIEIAFTMRIIQRAIAELHWGSPEHEVGGHGG